MNGPLASHLVLLSDLTEWKPGDKVRFLGCVETYDTRTGTLIMKHFFPKSAPLIFAYVDINLVLETIKSSDMQVGAWVNVIGCITSSTDIIAENGKKVEAKSNHEKVHVQSTILWPAGELQLDVYEKAMEKRKRIEALMSPK
ncbi:hypothetical protein K490DRAFT_41205 [Saccharata proteae CBS 121410]|uniref:Uncharacterized protein n=1 Tax=Saccharata proteae CBS 121410 TaxID=1314787 RepID=A0A9P4HYU0_9PEZI|nr:hypothetical protein K490DRAFT_41205 [Saccharata proteae CBS 121410]